MRAQAQTLVGLPPESVFSIVADDFIRNYPRWSPEVQRLGLLTPGPLRVGSRVRQIRIDQGRRSEAIFRVVALEPPNRVGFAEVSQRFHIEYRMQAQGERTRLHLAFELRLDLYMRPFEKLIRAVAQEGAERVARNIKGLVEREVTPTLSLRKR